MVFDGKVRAIAHTLTLPAVTTMTKTDMINGPAGSLELLVEMPTAGAADRNDHACRVPAGVCVIAHPHPRYGGTLQNKVVYTLARAALAEGLCAIRFNFRGVGASEGTFDEGVGETQDLLSVVAWAGGQFVGEPLLLAGFSFGAAMVVKASASCDPLGTILVAPPVAMGYLAGAVPRAPALVVQGRADQLVSVSATG